MSKYGSRKTFDLEWIERWARRVNEDRVMPRLGRFFNARFVLGVDDIDYLLHMHQGKVEKISEGLEPSDFGYEFALRAPARRPRLPCSTTSGRWRIRCTSSFRSKATS